MRSFVFALCTVFAIGMVPMTSIANGNGDPHDDDQPPNQEQPYSQDQTQGQAQIGSVDGNFSGNTTLVNPNLDSRDFRDHAETAARVEGSESGCHSGASGQGGTFGGSIGGSSASCDALNGLRAIHAAEAMGETTIARVTRVNVVVRNSARVLLSIVTLGLL